MELLGVCNYYTITFGSNLFIGHMVSRDHGICNAPVMFISLINHNRFIFDFRSENNRIISTFCKRNV